MKLHNDGNNESNGGEQILESTKNETRDQEGEAANVDDDIESESESTARSES